MKLNIKDALSKNGLLKIVSLVIAFVTWFIVANSISDDSRFGIQDVPVDMNILSSSVMSKLGLEATGADELKVDVVVQGKRYIIGNLTAADVKIVPDLSKVQGAGTYPISLTGSDVNQKGFEVVSINPSTVAVRFDRFASKKLTIETDITGVSSPEGYLIENEIVSPKEIIITGPETDVSKVSRCVAMVKVGETLKDSYSVKTDIKLLDSDGNLVDTKYISMDTKDAQVTIPILKTKEVDLTTGFINMPEGFPENELKFNISKDTLKIAGPAATVDEMGEFTLGYIDMKNLGPDSVFSYDVKLPSGFVNVENVKTVQVAFDSTGYTSAKFTLTNIMPINVPIGYEVNVETLQLNDVEIIAPEDIMDSLSAGDLIAEVDLSEREINGGNYTFPVSVYSPSGLPVWAMGNYEAIVSIKKL
ncbi:MAG: CdaR family protein [Oscillospiraceae bacterium]